MKSRFSQTSYYETPLFNEMVESYLSTVFKELAAQFTLQSAKGNSGRDGFEKGERYISAVINMADMPYHIHILNGIFPALRVFEQDLKERNLIAHETTPLFLKTLIVGFTLHDLNKLTAKKLEEAVRDDLENICQRLVVAQFFPEWQSWINEIRYLILRTENRTTVFSFDYPIHEDYTEFVHNTLGEVCHLADAFASIDKTDTVAEFYDRVCQIKYKYRPLGEIWPLSYVEISANIFTLLSQKLLALTKTKRQDEILFQLRNGFVYVGEPLSAQEREAVIQAFAGEDPNIDPIEVMVNSTIVDFQSCNFGFLDSRPLTPKALGQIIARGYAESNKINFLSTYTDLSKAGGVGFTYMATLIEETGLPIHSVSRPNSEEDYFYVLDQKWDEFNDAQREKLTLFALYKIRYLCAKTVKAWKKELDEMKKTLAEKSPDFKSHTTLAAMLKMKGHEENEDALSEVVTGLQTEICQTLSKDLSASSNPELAQFAQTYLTGNFGSQLQAVFDSINAQMPEKKDMCLFSGKPAFKPYTAADAHGVKPRGAFTNRTVTTLKNTNASVSFLFNAELEMRKTFCAGKTDFNSCRYFDFGEYLINMDTRSLLAVLAQAKDFEHDGQKMEITIDDKTFDYNLDGLNFESISDDVKGNVYFIQRNLKLIQATGFRIFTNSIINSYQPHHEMFSFDNCMPFVKKLGWDRIRIDEVSDRLLELNMFLTLGSSRMASNILSFCEDRRAVFSSYADLSDDDKKKAGKSFTNYAFHILPKYHKEYDMSAMQNLAELAIKMARPQSDSSSQETKLIRDSLDLLKVNVKEKRDRETTIGQIVGELRQTAKTYPYFSEQQALPFATAIYDDVFVKEWHKQFPQPSRLRNWINEFGFWYKSFHYEVMKKRNIEEGIETLQKSGQAVTEAAIMDWLRTKQAKAMKNHENEYRTVYQKYFNQQA